MSQGTTSRAFPRTPSLCVAERCAARGHLVELHDSGRMLLLVHLLLPLEQRVLAVPAAADALVVLLVHHRAHAAQAAQAAPARAMDAVGGLAGAGVGAQGVLAGAGELVCEPQRTGVVTPTQDPFPAVEDLPPDVTAVPVPCTCPGDL